MIKLSRPDIFRALAPLFFLLLSCCFSSCEKEPGPTPIVSTPDPGGNTGQPSVEVDTVRYLALGDSYTIGQAVSYEGRWPVQLAAQLQTEFPDTIYYIEEPAIIARTGWTTSGLLQAIASAEDTLRPPYHLVSLLIGVNNQFQRRPIDNYRTEFTELLEQAITFAGDDPSRVLVLSIPDYAFTPFGQGWGNPEATSEEIDQFNVVNREITEMYGVAYFNITPISRQGLDKPELVAEDGLHPSGMMYALWVEEVLAYVVSLLE